MNRKPANWLAAHLSADLHYDLNETIQNIPSVGDGKEEWAQALAQGIEQATYISAERMKELLSNRSIIRFSRCVEALSLRPELTEPQALALIWWSLDFNADGEFYVANPSALFNIAEKSSLDIDLVYSYSGDDGEYKSRIIEATGIDAGARRTAKILFQQFRKGD